MKAEEIPEEWVEAGARATHARAQAKYGLPGWDDAPEVFRTMAREDSASALAAVIPQVKAAALREWIAEWPTTPDDNTFLARVADDGLRRADRIELDEV